MDIGQRNSSIAMARTQLTDVPEHAFPPGFGVRLYRAGDERHWVELHLAADKHTEVRPELFESQFGRDAQELSQRQAYLLDSAGRVVGTASAWRDDKYQRPELGRIHWVAIHPEYQGRGLAKPLMTYLCRRLRELGHRKAYLTTSTVRVPAIGLYLRFGFQPWIRDEEERAAWGELRGVLPDVGAPLEFSAL